MQCVCFLWIVHSHFEVYGIVAIACVCCVVSSVVFGFLFLMCSHVLCIVINCINVVLLQPTPACSMWCIALLFVSGVVVSCCYCIVILHLCCLLCLLFACIERCVFVIVCVVSCLSKPCWFSFFACLCSFDVSCRV